VINPRYRQIATANSTYRAIARQPFAVDATDEQEPFDFITL